MRTSSASIFFPTDKAPEPQTISPFTLPTIFVAPDTDTLPPLTSPTILQHQLA